MRIYEQKNILERNINYSNAYIFPIFFIFTIFSKK